MTPELVSVITPVFGGTETLSECVKSVLQQSHAHWEMLLVADDGVDYASELDRVGISDERLRFLDSGGYRRGPNIARNVGLQAARGAWIAPLDADDVFYSERLERLLFHAHRTGLALDNGHIVDHASAIPLGCLLPLGLGSNFGIEDYVRTDVPLLFLFHRSLIPRGWDVIQRGADTLFNLRALERAGQAGIDSTPLHEYRVVDTSLCHSPDAIARFEDAYALTLSRLRSDGLGFRNSWFRSRVIEYLERKQKLNRLYARAQVEGFNGTFQHFLDRCAA